MMRKFLSKQVVLILLWPILAISNIEENSVEIEIVQSFRERNPADLLVLPFWDDKGAVFAAPYDLGELLSWIEPAVQAKDFDGKQGKFITLYPHGLKETRVVLLGLGKEEKCSLETLRRSYSEVIKSFRNKGVANFSFLVPQIEQFQSIEVSSALVEAVGLSSYVFDDLKWDLLKEETKTSLQKVTLIGADSNVMEGCQKALKIVTAVNFSRDLVNGNADHINPQAISEIAKGLSNEYKNIKTTVLGKSEIEKEKMGLLLAVSRGSHLDPAFVILEYTGNPNSSDRSAIIGKGITYDTGGLNLKPTGSMETMKCDMAGAAAVLGTMRALASLNVPVNVVGVIPATENPIGPFAYKPGDVYHSHAGTTVEITNTDAEGRLVLADAISYTLKYLKPNRIIDLATLTGAIVVALGEEATGLFSNDEELTSRLINAGSATSERVWRMPLFPEYKEILKSSIADIKNAGGREAGSATAAIFLERFVKETPWAHLDIAGTAYLNKPKYYHPTHATGVGVRMLVNFFENLH